MPTSRRELMAGGGAVLAASLMPGGGDAAFDAAYDTAYRQAFAEFEAAVRPVSEIYWDGYNRAVADAYARDAAGRPRGTAARASA